MIWTPKQKRIVRPSMAECQGLGLGLGFGGGASTSVFDPATLALSGWYKDYAVALPWAGAASAGASGTPTLQAAGLGAPDAGVTLNGKHSAAFPADKFIRDSVGSVGTYVTLTAWRAVILARINSAAAPGAQRYNDAAWLQDGGNGNWGIGLNSSDVFVYQFVSGVYKVASVGYPGTGWCMVDASFDGATLSISVDGGTPGTFASGTPIDYSADPLLVGASYNGATKLDGDIMEIMTAKTTLASTSSARFKAYFNARYGLSL